MYLMISCSVSLEYGLPDQWTMHSLKAMIGTAIPLQRRDDDHVQKSGSHRF
jgi:hypothetical protein